MAEAGAESYWRRVGDQGAGEGLRRESKARIRKSATPLRAAYAGTFAVGRWRGWKEGQMLKKKALRRYAPRGRREMVWYVVELAGRPNLEENKAQGRCAPRRRREMVWYMSEFQSSNKKRRRGATRRASVGRWCALRGESKSRIKQRAAAGRWCGAWWSTRGVHISNKRRHRGATHPAGVGRRCDTWWTSQGVRSSNKQRRRGATRRTGAGTWVVRNALRRESQSRIKTTRSGATDRLRVGRRWRWGGVGEKARY
jgi:hypothetical protein